MKKIPTHFTDNSLINPTNPIKVNLIGAGGTGSNMAATLGRLNHALWALGHPGLQVNIWDDDEVSEANCGRQLFMTSEIGMNKAVARVNNLNRGFGTNWKAITKRFIRFTESFIPADALASLYISCVDTVQARFDIAESLKTIAAKYKGKSDHPLYWIDFGNSRSSGQVLLSTIGTISQPQSKKYFPVGTLPFITEEYKELLQESANDNQPSCSLAEALNHQDLFINSALAHMGSSLLWNLFREGKTVYRGFFLNLATLRAEPIPVTAPKPTEQILENAA